MSSTTQKNNNYVLVLFHTKGSYENDWEPMTPAGNGNRNFKWNGQNYHRDDHLMVSHGHNTLILTRTRKNEAFTFWGKVDKIESAEVVEVEKGTPKRYILRQNDRDQEFNGIRPGTKLHRSDGLAWMKSALYRLGLQRIGGNHLGGIQACIQRRQGRPAAGVHHRAPVSDQDDEDKRGGGLHPLDDQRQLRMGGGNKD